MKKANEIKKIFLLVSVFVFVLMTVKINSNADDRMKKFFDNAVLTGDSVAKHFGNYVSKNKKTLPGNMTFLAEGSFSLHNAVKSVDDKNAVFPVYKGKKMKIEDSIALIKPKYVFMFFGINDLGIEGPEKCLKMYDEQIDRIQKNCGNNLKIFIISATYLHADKANVGKNLNNKNIKKFNSLLKKYCETEKKATYIDLASKLKDKKGNLKDEYCNDRYCHHNEKAFKIWAKVLKNAAKKEIEK